MTPSEPAEVLTRLETDFRSDSTNLKRLEIELAAALLSARLFGENAGFPEGWTVSWKRRWDSVEASLARLGSRIGEMDDAIESRDVDRLRVATEAWKSAQDEDVVLGEDLGFIRSLAGQLGSAARKTWNGLARPVEVHLESIHDCGQSLRERLELLKAHSPDQVESPVTVAGGEKAEAEPFDHDQRKASVELNREQHRFAGFLDIIKGLTIWVETPAERMRKNRSLTVDEA